MKRLGIVTDISYRGTLVVRAELVPENGTEVFTGEGLRAGRVERVFGPVLHPYVSVKPASGRQKLMGLVGKKLYIE